VGNPEVKLRLVLNLWYLNQFLQMQSFKYEDLHIAALMFEQGECLFKFNTNLGTTMLIFGLNTTNAWGSWTALRIIMSLKFY